MSDEYAASGFKGSLADDSAADYIPRSTDSNMNNTTAGAGIGTGSGSDYETKNYPPPGDSTSSGGYGSSTNSFSSRPSYNNPSQNTSTSTFSHENSRQSLLDQSTNGTSLSGQLGDAKQGVDERSRADYAHERGGDMSGMNPYGGSSMDSRKDAEESLGSAYTGRRLEGGEDSGAGGY